MCGIMKYNDSCMLPLTASLVLICIRYVVLKYAATVDCLDLNLDHISIS